MNVITRYLLFALAALMTLVTSVEADLVVVVNDSNSVSDLSMNELKRIYLGKITDYKNGQEIILGEYAPENEDFYQTVLGMSTRKTRMHWMKLVFSGGLATPPKVFKKIEKVRQFIRDTEGAICFIKSSEVDKGMKVLTIDGKRPGEEGYLLQQQPITEPPDLQEEGR